MAEKQPPWHRGVSAVCGDGPGSGAGLLPSPWTILLSPAEYRDLRDVLSLSLPSFSLVLAKRLE